MQQHTIPRFYLDGFTDPSTPLGHKPSVWVHADPECRWRRRAPKNLTIEPNYYSTVDGEGAVSHDLEAFLGAIETEAAKVLRDVIATGQRLDDASKEALAFFVAAMHLRIPRLHAELVPGMSEAGLADARSAWEQIRSDAARLEAFRQELIAKTGRNVDVEKSMEATLYPADGKPELSRGYLIRSVLSDVPRIAAAINQMGWILLVTTAPNWFVTSDWPVSLWEAAHGDSPFQAGIGIPEVQLTFPLTRQCALLAVWKNAPPSFVSADAGLVAKVNVRSVRLAATIYAPSRGFLGSDGVTSRTTGRPLSDDAGPSKAAGAGST